MLARSLGLLSAVAARLALIASVFGGLSAPAHELAPDGQPFDVVIVGGSTAALAAAFSAADEGATVALIEPTDLLGGQISSSGVPAIDEAWHSVETPGAEPYSVAKVARDPRNMTPFFRDACLATGNPGDGWVSRFCFEPKPFVERFFEPRVRALKDRLVVYHDTVVKRVSTSGNRVVGVEAIARTPRAGVAAKGYDRLPSEDLVDWYSPRDSARFTKRVLDFHSGDKPCVYMDATEWGEALALADAPYLQGVETEDGGRDGDDTCGQATVFCFVQKLHATPQANHPQIETIPRMGYGAYRENPDAWQRIWTYRRIRGEGPTAKPGDLCLQNWGYSETSVPGGGEGGNDYPFGYLFLSKAKSAATATDWVGGIDLAVLAAAEKRALAWHDWFRRHAPLDDSGESIDPDCFTLAGDVLGTGHGLAKLPYIRDTRRSIGVDGFLLKFADLIGPAERKTGTAFPDRVALGAYAADIHPIVGCTYPPYVHENHPTLPFYVPLRALTNERYANLLVAGKTMAQTFLANSATRLHPIEWSSGTAAGVMAAEMARSGATAAEACDDAERLRGLVARYTPIDWTIEEVVTGGAARR
ncbi:MAG: FAD-dependent oxidoreductase [Lacipirellulaceae bacterium]